MDPEANLKEQLAIVCSLLEQWDEDDGLDLEAWLETAGHHDPDISKFIKEDFRDRLTRLQSIREDAYRLAELVNGLDGWIRGGGFLPKRWQPEETKG